MTPYLVGYYKPTYEFTRIPEFMAIFDRQGTLVGLTGPATSRQAAWDARLFALSPQLRSVLQNLCRVLDTPAFDVRNAEYDDPDLDKLHAALKEAREVLHLVENGLPVR